MSITEDDKILIFCPLLMAHPFPPDDQPGCLIEKCPKCKQEMWVSSKKRALCQERFNLKLKTIILCYECSISYLYHLSDSKINEIEMLVKDHKRSQFKITANTWRQHPKTNLLKIYKEDYYFDFWAMRNSY